MRTSKSITPEQARLIWESCQKAEARRAEKMPTELDALLSMFDAFQRLKELGWNEAIYCPKDGTVFDAIEAGSSGIHDCSYQGEWPKGRWEIYEAFDIWPSNPVLFRLKPPV